MPCLGDQFSLADLLLGTGRVRDEVPNDRGSCASTSRPRPRDPLLAFEASEDAGISSSNCGSRRKYEEYEESSGCDGGVAKYGASYGMVRGIGVVVRLVGFLGSRVKADGVGEAVEDPLLEVDCLERLQLDLVEAVSRHARGSVGAAFLLCDHGGMNKCFLGPELEGGASTGTSFSSSGVLGISGDLSVEPFRLDLKLRRSLRKTGVDGVLVLGVADRRDESELHRCSSSSGGGVGRWAGGEREALEESGLAVTAVENNWLSAGGMEGSTAS